MRFGICGVKQLSHMLRRFKNAKKCCLVLFFSIVVEYAEYALMRCAIKLAATVWLLLFMSW